MKCKKCGKEFLSIDGEICPHCGHDQTKTITVENFKTIPSVPVSASNGSSETRKEWIFVLIGLILIMLLWFAPSQALTNEAIEDIRDNYSSSSNEMIELYEETIPSIYNLMFGGEEIIEVGSRQYILDYDKLNITNSTLEWIFWFHLLAIASSFICIFNPGKAIKSFTIVLLGVCAVGFFTVITNTGSEMLTALNSVLGGKYTQNDFLTLGFGGWAPIFIYIIIGSVAVHFHNED